MVKMVHRLSPRSATVAEKLAKAEGKTVPEFLHDLILDYEKGLSFDKPKDE